MNVVYFLCSSQGGSIALLVRLYMHRVWYWRVYVNELSAFNSFLLYLFMDNST